MQIIVLYINFKNPGGNKKKQKKTPTIAKTFEFFF